MTAVAGFADTRYRAPVTEGASDGDDQERAIAWERELARSVGQRVAKFRKERSLTVQQLSDQLRTRLGITLKRTALSNLESGQRQTVGLAETLGLAYVLGVPPLRLIVPLDQEEVEIVPGARMHPWLAAQWITGDGPPPFAEFTLDMVKEHLAQVHFLGMYRQHDALVGQWARALQMAESAERQQEIEKMLARVRWDMREREAVPPPLPRGLEQAVDQDARPDTGGRED